MVVREVDWLELPDHLTTFMAYKLSRCDFIRFGVVCKFWQSVYIAHPRHSLPHQLPLVLLPNPEFGEDSHDIYDFFENRISGLHVRVPYAMDCIGSNHGWLATVNDEHQQKVRVCLSNPFLPVNNIINLPPLERIFWRPDLRSVYLSANPTLDTNYVVMVILKKYGRLAFIKPAAGKAEWTFPDIKCERIDDVLYYRDQFYFVDMSGELFACDVNQPGHPKVSPVLAPPPNSTFERQKTKYLYLVELSSGELLLIKRLRTDIDKEHYTTGFSAYKMNPQVELKWIEVQNLSGDTVFLGTYSSSSVQASDFPECKPNCIYFTDHGFIKNDSWFRPDYIGVFNLENGSIIERQCPVENPTYYTTQPPIWVEPTLLQLC